MWLSREEAGMSLQPPHTPPFHNVISRDECQPLGVAGFFFCTHESLPQQPGRPRKELQQVYSGLTARGSNGPKHG